MIFKGGSMILIKIYGLDQFVVGNYSKDNTSNLAKLFEVKEEEILFYAPNSFIFFKGEEQTSWNATVEILAPHKHHPLQENIANYLIKTLSEISINVHLIFNYYDEHHYVSYLNNKYPRFLTDANSVKIETTDVDDEDLTDEDKVYTGNIFKDFNKKK